MITQYVKHAHTYTQTGVSFIGKFCKEDLPKINFN